MHNDHCILGLTGVWVGARGRSSRMVDGFYSVFYGSPSLQDAFILSVGCEISTARMICTKLLTQKNRSDISHSKHSFTTIVCPFNTA